MAARKRNPNGSGNTSQREDEALRTQSRTYLLNEFGELSVAAPAQKRSDILCSAAHAATVRGAGPAVGHRGRRGHLARR
jgi:hypothetical protein